MNNIEQLEKDIQENYYSKRFNAFCVYCKQKRRIINDYHLRCSKCNIGYTLSTSNVFNKSIHIVSFSFFFVNLLENDNIHIIYILKENKILFSKPNCHTKNKHFYNFEDKENSSFKEFIKEYKKLKKFKKLNLFM